MPISIHCRELGMDCPFETMGETEDDVLDSVMRHMHLEHSEEIEDWFNILNVHQAARKAIRERAD